MSEDFITITGLEATGYHGMFDSERRDGQRFVVDVVAWLSVDTVSDDLASSLDYSLIASEVVEIVEGPAVDLIETLAGRIADRVLSHGAVRATQVCVHKPQAPMGVTFADVAVTIYRRK